MVLTYTMKYNYYKTSLNLKHTLAFLPLTCGLGILAGRRQLQEGLVCRTSPWCSPCSSLLRGLQALVWLVMGNPHALPGPHSIRKWGRGLIGACREVCAYHRSLARAKMIYVASGRVGVFLPLNNSTYIFNLGSTITINPTKRFLILIISQVLL